MEQVPLSSPFFRQQVAAFLKTCGLRIEEPLDSYYVERDGEDRIVAGAGIGGDVLKCVAVAPEVRSEGLLAPLVSRIISEHPGVCLKVFTKPEYQAVFESLGFRLLASAPKAILLENGRGLENYCAYLCSRAVEGRCGVVVMNANPFTLGHRYLLEEARKQVDHLYVIPVKEDISAFPYEERLAMIKAACSRQRSFGRWPQDDNCHSERSEESLSGITVLDGSPYIISAATFPTYFLKDLSEAAETQMQLDLDLFRRWIAPALGGPVRFVGSEPADSLTARYNALMPDAVVIPRLHVGGEPVSASAVRAFLCAGQFREAAALCPESSWPYLLSALAQRALRTELDLPLKPGLVGPEGPGAHKDMDYATMLSGIRSLRPYWSRMALVSSAEELRQLGIEAEKAMMAATGGVNTHRGAIFAMGLAVNAAARFSQLTDNEQDMQNDLGEIAGRILCIQLKDNILVKTPLQGARRMADGGYREVFEKWLPQLRFFGQRPQDDNCHSERSEESLQRLLLAIMSTLDDTCVLKRAGETRAQEVQKEAAALLQNFSPEGLQALCRRYAEEGISPGGAADMLALTIFIDSII